MTTTQILNGRLAEVLLVEDNPNDVELTRIGFRRAKFSVNLHHVANGEECMRFLFKEGEYADKPSPDLILLDLNMPRMNGHEVLEEINRHEELKHLPVVILTSSQAETDILASYKLRCNAYMVKPVDFEQFTKVIDSLSDYWFTLVVLPSHIPPQMT
jgi:two-component system response regulator